MKPHQPHQLQILQEPSFTMVLPLQATVKYRAEAHHQPLSAAGLPQPTSFEHAVWLKYLSSTEAASSLEISQPHLWVPYTEHSQESLPTGQPHQQLCLIGEAYQKTVSNVEPSQWLPDCKASPTASHSRRLPPQAGMLPTGHAQPGSPPRKHPILEHDQ